MKGRVIEIVDIVSLKFASDKAAGWKIDILEPLERIALVIQVQNQERSMRLISNMRFLASCTY